MTIRSSPVGKFIRLFLYLKFGCKLGGGVWRLGTLISKLVLSEMLLLPKTAFTYFVFLVPGTGAFTEYSFWIDK